MRQSLNRLNPSSNDKSDEGFALPQILILSIALGVGITALLASSISRLTSSKINSLEINSRNASYSAITNLRALLNNTKGPLYYYWLSKVCSDNAIDVNKECPGGFMSPANKEIWPGERNNGRFPDLSKLFWTDSGNKFCQGSRGCVGRQVAPACTYSGTSNGGRIAWNNYINSLSGVIDNAEDSVGHNLANSTRNQLQSFFIKSLDYVGTEQGGETSILAEGFSRTNSGSNPLASNNKIRVNVGISKLVSDAGFAFISAGENDLDRDSSLYLGKFLVDGDKTGSIIWRRNVKDPNECVHLRAKTNVFNSGGLPANSNSEGGLWFQPLLLPGDPGHTDPFNNPGTTPHKMGDVFCTRFNSTNPNSKCRDLTSINRQGTRTGKVEIDNLFVKGEGAVFTVLTDDKNPVTLEVSGNIEISNGGKFCHNDFRSGINACGTGNPSNLTIIIKQNNTPNQAIACSNLNGGINLTNTASSAPNSFLMSHTGGNNENFSAFVYSPDTTFTTTTLNLPYYQTPIDKKAPNFRTTRQLVVAEGAYALVEDPSSVLDSDKEPILIKYNNRTIPFSNTSHNNPLGDWKIIAAGEKQRGQRNHPSNIMDDVILIYNTRFGHYSIYGIVKNNNVYNIALNNVNGKSFFRYLGRNLSLNHQEMRWINSYYGIDLKPTKIKPINIDGIAWVKNLCLDNRNTVNWSFNKDTKERLIERYGQNMNFGVPYYRGKVIASWDTLRDFDN